ncbi:Uncharacterised protein [Tissierella praeacuta]|nr:hypothetical protein EV204_11337 [Tissierella praeacuta]SUP02350.1 Uncharacterised protein [Tissierella praeacuta]
MEKINIDKDSAHNLCYSINHMLGNNINLGHIKELIFG